MKSKIIAIFLAILTLSSCKDFLELQPEYQISDENFYRNQNDFETALLGVYSTIRGLYSSSNILYATELATDNTEIQWSSPSTNEMQFDQNALTSTNTTVNAIWNTCLRVISQSSILLGRIDNVAFDPAVKDRIEGEAQFLRALSYFYMVRLFGNVPIVEQEFRSPSQIEAADLSLKPASEVYQVILRDLTSAETLLAATNTADKTRASLGTVKTLLGKVHLTMGNYAQAATTLKEVIDLNTYVLVDDYQRLFTNGNTNLPESIWEVQYVSGRTIGNNFSALFTPAITSMAIFRNNLQGAGRIVPTLDMMNAYEPNDVRKAISVNDSVPLINGKRTYNRYGLKFVDFNAIDLSDGSVTFTVFRYADVLLMYAEALNEQGNTGEVLPYINQVRARAKLGVLSGLSQEELRLAIERERRVEFLYEGHRWFDLVRTGRAREVLNAHFASLGLNFSLEEFELILPIPQTEVDLNPSEVRQNPNY